MIYPGSMCTWDECVLHCCMVKCHIYIYTYIYIYIMLCWFIVSEVAQLCLTLCNPMDCSLPGSSVHGLFHEEYWSRVPFPSPGNLPNPGIEPIFHIAGRHFTILATWVYSIVQIFYFFTDHFCNSIHYWKWDIEDYIIVESIFPLNSINFCFIYFGVLFLPVYMFLTVKYSCLPDPFINI